MHACDPGVYTRKHRSQFQDGFHLEFATFLEDQTNVFKSLKTQLIIIIIFFGKVANLARSQNVVFIAKADPAFPNGNEGPV